MHKFKDVDKEKEAQRIAKIKNFTIDFCILFGACCVSAFSTVGVMIPNGLTSGGITGVARILQNFVEVDFSILYYGLSAIVLIMVVIFIGWKELKKILLLSILYPAVLFLFEQMEFQLLETKDILLAAVFCGVFSGIYIGLIFWRGYASAGTDAIAKIICLKICPHAGLSKVLLMLDAVVIISSAFVYGRNIALYALITQMILTKTSEMVMYGFASKTVQLSILTSKPEQMSEFIMNEMDRGLTSLEVRGEYTHETKRQLMFICSPRESAIARKKLSEIDPNAFVSVTKVETVWGYGKGFSNIDEK
ncbi:MAG: YitT family protein [Bacillota bacterium]|nr:YitT family protein [Bacillota bacterium]